MKQQAPQNIFCDKDICARAIPAQPSKCPANLCASAVSRRSDRNTREQNLYFIPDSCFSQRLRRQQVVPQVPIYVFLRSWQPLIIHSLNRIWVSPWVMSPSEARRWATSTPSLARPHSVLVCTRDELSNPISCQLLVRAVLDVRYQTTPLTPLPSRSLRLPRAVRERVTFVGLHQTKRANPPTAFLNNLFTNESPMIKC